MSRKTTKRLAAIIAIVLALSLIFSVVISVILSGTAQGAGSSKLDDMKNNQKSIQEQKKRIQEQISQLKNAKNDKIKLKVALDEEIRLSEAEIEGISDLIQEYTIHIAEQQIAYETAEQDAVEATEKFLKRLRVMEENGETSFIGILMQSSSFSDLLGRYSTIAEISAYDRRAIEELAAKKEKITELKAELEDGKREQVGLKAEQVDAQAALLLRYKELDEMIAELEKDAVELAEALRKQEEEEKKVADEIKKYMEEQKKKGTVYVGGDFLWPLPGYSTISSPFGWRKHPTLGVQKMHTGVDLPAPGGTKILAANSGTVIIAAYNGGYGNCVSIDHGGGVATLYGHASKILVTKGQQVKKGDVIALVGTTGVSTGNHLHFEIIKNNVKQNPMAYFKKVS